jgi:hypothetical protein
LPGTSSSTSHGPSCRSACAIGHMGSNQPDLVLDARWSVCRLPGGCPISRVGRKWLRRGCCVFGSPPYLGPRRAQAPPPTDPRGSGGQSEAEHRRPQGVNAMGDIFAPTPIHTSGEEWLRSAASSPPHPLPVFRPAGTTAANQADEYPAGRIERRHGREHDR